MPSLMAARRVGVKFRWSYFSPFVDQKTPNLVCLCGSVDSLQHRFPSDDVLLRSRDDRDQVAKLSEIAPKF